MDLSVKKMLEAANHAVSRIDPLQVRDLIAADDALIIDVRDPSEVAKTGRIKGAINVSRGMLEFRADAESPYYDPAFRRDRTVLVYCASGGRSALSGKVLKDMGFNSVFNLGGFNECKEAGMPTETAWPISVADVG